MSEEVEVHVRQIDDQDETADTPPVAEMLRRMLLASIGAVAITFDEAERFIQRLVERGELAQKDGEKVLNEMMERFRQQPQEMQSKAEDVGGKVENNLEQFMGRMGVPSKRDIDELSAKVAQLAVRVEELRRTPGEPATGPAAGPGQTPPPPPPDIKP
jgi:poly(hydroxyalkanoate) granule-associated protein